MEQTILLIGGGGHCRSCIDVIETYGGFGIAGIVDGGLEKGSEILGYPVLGSDDDLPRLLRDITCNVLITVGQIRSAEVRERIASQLIELGAQLPVIVSPLAHVSNHARIGKGSIVMHHAVVNAAAEVGEFCILNTRSLVEHDARVGDFTHISTSAVLNGGVKVGSSSFIGSCAMVYQSVEIGNGVIVPGGKTIRKDILYAGVYRGEKDA